MQTFLLYLGVARGALAAARLACAGGALAGSGVTGHSWLCAVEGSRRVVLRVVWCVVNAYEWSTTSQAVKNRFLYPIRSSAEPSMFVWASLHESHLEGNRSIGRFAFWTRLVQICGFVAFSTTIVEPWRSQSVGMYLQRGRHRQSVRWRSSTQALP